jgi:tetratricopeptide (TPR) repeat protein
LPAVGGAGAAPSHPLAGSLAALLARPSFFLDHRTNGPLAEGEPGGMPDDLDQLLDTAMARHEAGQFDLAEAGYRAVLREDPNVPDALNLLAAILLERDDVDGSIALITRALEIEPNFPAALTSLAQAQRASGAPAAAAAAARRAIALDPEMAAAHFQLGRALIELGDHAGAAASLRQVTTLAPRSADALLSLGIALIRLNDLQAAADSLTAALKLDPDATGAAPVLTDLARAQRAAGDATAAVLTARRAAAVDPALPDAQVELGFALLETRDVAEAAEVLRHATEMAPRSLTAQIALGMALTRGKRHADAAKVWRVALALKPDDPALLMDFGGTLGELERFDEALAIYRRVDELAPGHRDARYSIAHALMRIGDVFAAAEVCRRALETNNGWPGLWLLLANCETMQGHFDEAAEAYRRVLELEPGSADALHALATLGKRADDHAAKVAAQTMLNDESRPIRDRAAAGFTLGSVSDRQGDYQEAFAAHARANSLLRADRAERGFVFDRDNHHRLVDGLISGFGERAFAETAGSGEPSELPVFVVGMPRSGTTLVEQIAASHKLVFGGGERKDISAILAALGGDPPPGRPVAWDWASARREAKAHVQRLLGLGGDAVRVINKMPLNVLLLGQIAMLFPRARVVVCRRDPRDMGLSCFFQYFREDGMMWTDDLADCGFFAREIDRLVAHWLKVLPIPILQIQYETLVENLETQSRRLIEFLGLEWDPACLSFHNTERIVRTASHWQVRQPLYASSVGRWRHYRRHLGPLLRELGGLVPADEENPDG